MSTDSSSAESSPPDDEDPGSRTGPGHLVIDGISYIPSNVVLTGIPKLSFKDDRAFGVLNNRGEAPRSYAQASELGIYFNDTRHLATLEASFNGTAPVALSHELRFNGSTLVVSMTNPDLPAIGGGDRIPRTTFLIRRILCLREDVLYEILAIRNFSQTTHTLQVEHWAGGRFDDIFEVRGFQRLHRGRLLAPEETGDSHGRNTTLLHYTGLDQKIRRTFISRLFQYEKIRVSPALSGVFSRIEVPAKGDVTLKVVYSFDQPAGTRLDGRSFEDMSVPEIMEVFSHKRGTTPFSGLSISTDNTIINRAVENAKTDIQMLLTTEPHGPSGTLLYPYAGIPWFSAAFGRDGLITAYQLLPWHPDLARGVLDYVFSTQGKSIDDFTDEQPGKIFHELRRGELANTREVPFIPYYGSVDSTPLSLILLHEYISWTRDIERLRAWWPRALAALKWIEKWGDSDGDGFVEYHKQSPNGLVNQGWKDSHDSIMHADGRLAQSPIRLCEVQGYAFRARIGMSALARLLGDESMANRLRMDALQLKTRFSERFWDHVRQYVYLALDAQQMPCSVRSSNMGHCLWSQIVSPEQAAQIAGHLTSDSMFSGYGIRTLADEEAAYNPMSYHNGSIWPHDNSLIMEGFRNYGQVAALERSAVGMVNVLETSTDFRLPELFCGFRKRGEEPPIPYEVACKPQAWAAGSVFLMLKAMLGLSMDPDQEHVVFRAPVLTPKLNALEIRGLCGRDWDMDLVLRRGRFGVSLEITRKSGNVRVLTVR